MLDNVNDDFDEKPALRAVGNAIVTRREQQGLSQRTLALRAGISRPFLSGVENGTRRATVVSLIRLARVLDTTAADLLAGID